MAKFEQMPNPTSPEEAEAQARLETMRKLQKEEVEQEVETAFNLMGEDKEAGIKEMKRRQEEKLKKSSEKPGTQERTA